jgi:ABC-type phosphate/phosphonate transport system ATPase subunit
MNKERDYSPVVDALGPILYGLPGKIVAIDGLPGVGKTTLGRFLAYRFNISLIETDLFLIERQGRLVYRNDEITRIIAKRVDAYSPRPMIIESAVVLRVLAELKRKPDFTIYITNQDAPESHGDLLADLNAYEAQFRPRGRADLSIEFQGCR